MVSYPLGWRPSWNFRKGQRVRMFINQFQPERLVRVEPAEISPVGPICQCVASPSHCPAEDPAPASCPVLLAGGQHASRSGPARSANCPLHLHRLLCFGQRGFLTIQFPPVSAGASFSQNTFPLVIGGEMMITTTVTIYN